MSEHDELVDRVVGLSVNEPREYARNLGEPAHRAVIAGFLPDPWAQPKGSSLLMKLTTEEVVRFGEKSSKVFYAAIRHVGSEWASLLRGHWLAAGLAIPRPGTDAEIQEGSLIAANVDYIAIAIVHPDLSR